MRKLATNDTGDNFFARQQELGGPAIEICQRRTLAPLVADLLDRFRYEGGYVVAKPAGAGRLDLGTGSGDLRVGVRPGVTAELDLSSGSGRARSELEVHSDPREQASTLTIKGRTGSGDVLITRSAVPAA